MLFRSELDFTLREVPFDDSESAACETLIYPFLRKCGARLEALTSGAISPLRMMLIYRVCLIIWWPGGRPLVRLLDQPYLPVVEAKKDDFTRGWGQCLAAMPAQKLERPAGADDLRYHDKWPGLAVRATAC